ncbi:MAG TPA: division/cell wall cluster transcriptional repressor MraZ [Gammaproteobacteria bacterium]|nr:division/cell wall cluster transcriptional repressor MraZ [Gammaproteobacteria bacterium]
MFRGVSTLNLDAKGRMTMPTKYRERLEAQSNGQLIITIDPEDRCLWLYPLPVWEGIERSLDSLPSLDKGSRRMQRLLIGHATECDLDSQGRMLLPPPLREFAKLDKQIVLIGQGKKFEVWDELTWAERRNKWLNEDMEDYRELSDDMKKLSL